MIAFKTAAANAVMAVALGFPQLVSADGFTGADVLGWSQEAQDSMFQTSVGMLAVVAAQMDDHPNLAECIDGWYFADDAAKPARNDAIREALTRFPDYHPQIIIFSVVEKQCGGF